MKIYQVVLLSELTSNLPNNVTENLYLETDLTNTFNFLLGIKENDNKLNQHFDITNYMIYVWESGRVVGYWRWNDIDNNYSYFDYSCRCFTETVEYFTSEDAYIIHQDDYLN